MQRRWVVLVVVGGVLLGAVLAVWLARAPRQLTDPRAAGVTAANFDRIQEGMSAEEVSHLFGVPPGDYRRPPGFLMVGPGHVPWTEKARGGKLSIWYVPGCHAEVLFDSNGRVVGKYWHIEVNR